MNSDFKGSSFSTIPGLSTLSSRMILRVKFYTHTHTHTVSYKPPSSVKFKIWSTRRRQ